jgi:hypothetical protein
MPPIPLEMILQRARAEAEEMIAKRGAGYVSEDEEVVDRRSRAARAAAGDVRGGGSGGRGRGKARASSSFRVASERDGGGQRGATASKRARCGG